MARGEAYYRGIRGSAALRTARLGQATVPAEALAPGEMRRVPYAGELLGAARVRSGFAAVPLEAFDRAAERLQAEEQAAYLQLLRLSFGEGRNWARAGKRELMARLRLSERRLLRVLDGLVGHGFVRPLHRDNRGTLWRVALPREAFGEPLGDDVLLGRAAPLPTAERAPLSAVHATGLDRAGAGSPQRRRLARGTPSAGVGTPAAAPVRALPPPVVAAARERAWARALCQARGRDGDEALAEALREVRELVEEGQPPGRIEAAIEAVRRAARTDGPDEAGGAEAAGGTEAR